MKRIILIMISCILLSLILCSCVPAIISRTPVNAKCVSEHNDSEYDYVQYVDPDDGETYTVRYERTVHYSASYEIQYKVKYADNSMDFIWESVTEEEYNRFMGGE